MSKPSFELEDEYNSGEGVTLASQGQSHNQTIDSIREVSYEKLKFKLKDVVLYIISEKWKIVGCSVSTEIKKMVN